MTNYRDAIQADNCSDALVQAKAEGWRLQYWLTSAGLEVVAHRYVHGGGEVKQLGAPMELCAVARAVVGPLVSFDSLQRQD